MELRERQIDIEQANFDLIVARATNEFAGSVTASFGVQANDEDFSNLFETPTNTPAIGLTFNIPLFDWGERKSEIICFVFESAKNTKPVDYDGLF